MAMNLGAMLGGNSAASMLRQLGLLLGIAASVAVGVAVVMWSQTPNYSLLYGSLSDRDVSEVMKVLQGSQIEYQLDPATGAVMVPSSKVYEARMKLAASGIPKSASLGFEMLEKEQVFGTSQFMEQARYQRAVEEELARSIAKLNNVRGARVHLAVPKQSVFAREKKGPSASVLVDLYPGRVLEDGQVAAIAHLVSASVPNLQMSAVTVVDQQGRLLTRPEGSADMVETARRFDYAKRVEQSYVNRIEYILAPIVGADGAKAQVTAELDFTATEQTSETFNPDLPSVRSEQLMEEKRAGPGEEGIPGALSNQPPGAVLVPETTVAKPGAVAAAAVPQNSRKQETRNFEVDKTISHSRMALGTIRRLSVAVVVNNKRGVDASGQATRTELSTEELARITSVVKEAIGFNALRGDTVHVINADFAAPPAPGAVPEPPLWERPWVWDIAKQLFGGLFALVVVFGVLGPVMRNLLRREGLDSAPALPAAGERPAMALPAASAGETSDSTARGAQAGGSAAIRLAQVPAVASDIEAVKSYVKQEPKVAAQVVKSWLGGEE